MSIRDCDNCKGRWLCDDYKNWVCLGQKAPDAYLCPKFQYDDEGDDE